MRHKSHVMSYELRATRSSGFTLIEIILVVSILLILTSVLLSSFAGLQTKTVLKASTDDLITRLRDAQHKAISGSASSKWGVNFNLDDTPDSYSTFSGSSYAAGSNKVKNFLEPALSFYQVRVGDDPITAGSVDLVFERSSGQPLLCSATCLIEVKLISGGGSNCVSVNKEGGISFTTGVCDFS